MDILYQLQWQGVQRPCGRLSAMDKRLYLWWAPKENITVISGAYPIFQYRQTPAFFRGMDFDFHFMPADSWDYHLTASFIRANERTTGNYLPYIPLSVSTMSFHGTTEPGRISGCVWVSGTVSWQNRPGLTRIRILSRTLLRHTIFGADVDLECPVRCGHILRFMISADNILNKEYKEYTNRSRYYAHDMGRDVRCGVSWSFWLITRHNQQTYLITSKMKTNVCKIALMLLMGASFTLLFNSCSKDPVIPENETKTNCMKILPKWQSVLWNATCMQIGMKYRKSVVLIRIRNLQPDTWNVFKK